MRARLLTAVLAFGALGCAGGVYSAEVTATTPQLVYIEPGIQVVVDSDIPIFYTDSFYWRYYDNRWYRSRHASGGWVRHDGIPQHLRRIERPQQYVHYRPQRTPAPVVRDHRTPPPLVRDHRTQPAPRIEPKQPDRDPRRGPEDKEDKDKNKKNKDKNKKPDNPPHKHG